MSDQSKEHDPQGEQGGQTNESASTQGDGATSLGGARSGYLVATGEGLVCRTDEGDSAEYKAADGAGEGDACTVGGSAE